MRAALTIVVTMWALWRTYASGNYLRIRWYLWSMLGAAVFTEIYLGAIGSREDATYWILYSVLTACILANAWLVSLDFVWKNPLRLVVMSAATASGVAGYFLAAVMMGTPSPEAMLLITQAAVLAAAGLQVVLSTPIVFPLNAYVYGEDIPLRTLGRFWMVQACMFYIMASGTALAPEAWGKVGEWLPAVVGIAFLLKLGFGLKPSVWMPARIH